MKVALAAWNMGASVPSFQYMINRLSRVCLENQDCDVLVLPEYWAMQILDTAPETLKQTDEVAWMAAQLDGHNLTSEIQILAEKYGMAILPGSWPVKTDAGYVNRAHFIDSDDVQHVQDKMALTDEETDRMGWYLKPGKKLDVFEWHGATCAIAICHDTANSREFKTVADNWVQVVFMPSMCEFEGTDKTVDGHRWIFNHAKMRSEEIGCYVACVGSVGMQTLGDNRVEKNVGGAALYRDGLCVAEIGPMSKGRGAVAHILKVDIDV